MTGLTANDVCGLKHEDDAPWVVDNAAYFVRRLWYSTSAQAYIQKSKQFDGSVFDKGSSEFNPISDECIQAMLFKHLKLNRIDEYTDNAAELEQDIEHVEDDESVLLLHNPKRKQSLLYAFDDKLRNSIAHGTFNQLKNGQYLFVGQFKARQNSPINFFLRVCGLDLLETFNDEISSLCHAGILEVLEKAYSNLHQLAPVAPRLYRREADNALVYFDSNFKFARSMDAGSQDVQLLNRISEHVDHGLFRSANILYYDISEYSVSHFAAIKETCGNVHVVPRNCLMEHLGVSTMR